MLLLLANEMGLIPRRVASTHGGEYHSPCPNCGGKDRFIIWNAIDRFFCRRCEKKGDAIQFCREFMNLDFQSACAKVNRIPAQISYGINYRRHVWEPKVAPLPSLIWRKKALEFVLARHLSLMANKPALQLLFDRGLTIPTIRKASLGWNSWDQFLPHTVWDLPKKEDPTGRPTNLWLPSGIVIPTQSDGNIIKIKIRRNEWKIGDDSSKYVEISGSMQCPSLFGDKKSVILVVEAEFDALLVQQVASDLCACLALGGASKRPDKETHELLQKASLLLICLDFDEAGKSAFRFWKENYPQAQAWPVPKEKSPGDAFKAKVDLRQWLIEGLKHYKKE